MQQQLIITCVTLGLLALFVMRGYVRPMLAPAAVSSSFPQAPAYWVEQELLFDSMEPVLPGSQVRLSTRSPNLFHGRRLAVLDQLAPYFEVCDLLIDDEAQLSTIGVAPESAWRLSHVCLPLDPVQPGQEVVIVVRNHSADAQHFSAALQGRGEVL